MTVFNKQYNTCQLCCSVQIPFVPLWGDLARVLGHWAFGPMRSLLLCIGQRKSQLLWPALPHFLSQSTSTCSVHQKSFQVLFETWKRRRGGRNQSLLFQAFNRMALSSRNSQNTTLLLTSLFLVCFALFFPISSFPSFWVTFFPSSSGILWVLWLHKYKNKAPSEKKWK